MKGGEGKWGIRGGMSDGVKGQCDALTNELVRCFFLLCLQLF